MANNLRLAHGTSQARFNHLPSFQADPGLLHASGICQRHMSVFSYDEDGGGCCGSDNGVGNDDDDEYRPNNNRPNISNNDSNGNNNVNVEA